MGATSQKRKRLPVALETQILTESRRRCCLCFHFDADASQKDGQIAHIDRQRNNNVASNLAFLCLPHHDMYDSPHSQSKSITAAELRHAKHSLYGTIQKESTSMRVALRVTIEADFDKLDPAERRVLLENALAMVQLKGEVRILNIERGSVQFTIEIEADDAAHLCKVFSSGVLAEAGVVDIRLERHNKKRTTFAEAFDSTCHGVSRQQASEVVMNSDSTAFIRGSDVVPPSKAFFGLHLKRFTEKYSVLVVTSGPIEIQVAYPLNHEFIPTAVGAEPLGVLRRFVELFGLESELGGRQSTLWIGERVTAPVNVFRKEDLIKHAPEFVRQPDGEPFEILALLGDGPFLSPTVDIHLLFAVSYARYAPSLVGLGKKVTTLTSNRHFMTHRRNP